MSESVVSGLQPGDVLAGKYRVLRVLGIGGVGVVVAAHHLHLDATVAVKMLLPEALANPAAVGRFVREARTAVKIQSEHVARVSDVGVLDSGAPYMVMEYLEGTDLHAWVRERGPLPVAQAVDFVLQACVAVADAHVLGIVHRDLKPANLFCVRRSDGELTIKVLDFGISKLTGSEASAGPELTKTSSIMGTPFYMSPEQMRSSKTVDTRTDIWALGVILFELLGGRPPFTANSTMELAVMIATEEAPPLTAVRPDVPPGLQAVVSRCMEKDPALRYPDVSELAAALLPFAPPEARRLVDRVQGILRGSAVPSMPRVPQGERPALPGPHAAASATLLPFGRTETEGTKGRSVAVGLGVFGGTLVAATLLVLLVPRSASGPAAVASPEASSVPAAALAAPPAASTVIATMPVATSASPPSTGAPTAPAVSSAPSASPKPKPSPPRAAPPPSCNPPYTINAAGHRAYKPECK